MGTNGAVGEAVVESDLMNDCSWVILDVTVGSCASSLVIAKTPPSSPVDGTVDS